MRHVDPYRISLKSEMEDLHHCTFVATTSVALSRQAFAGLTSQESFVIAVRNERIAACLIFEAQ